MIKQSIAIGLSYGFILALQFLGPRVGEILLGVSYWFQDYLRYLVEEPYRV